MCWVGPTPGRMWIVPQPDVHSARMIPRFSCKSKLEVQTSHRLRSIGVASAGNSGMTNSLQRCGIISRVRSCLCSMLLI